MKCGWRRYWWEREGEEGREGERGRALDLEGSEVCILYDRARGARETLASRSEVVRKRGEWAS